LLNNVNAEESFILTANIVPNLSLGEDREDSDIVSMNLNFSKSNEICKSTSCILEIPKEGSVSAFFSAPSGTENHVTFYVDFFVGSSK
jgi:hypothetical protein